MRRWIVLWVLIALVLVVSACNNQLPDQGPSSKAEPPVTRAPQDSADKDKNPLKVMNGRNEVDPFVNTKIGRI